jgi:hypothetical protein
MRSEVRAYSHQGHGPRAHYPSSEFEISEEGDVRRVVHLPTGIMIETMRRPAIYRGRGVLIGP